MWRTEHEGADVQAFYDTLPSGVVIPIQVALAVPSSPDPIISRFSAVHLPNSPLALAQNPAPDAPPLSCGSWSQWRGTEAVERCPPGIISRLMLPMGVAENSTKLRVVTTRGC